VFYKYPTPFNTVRIKSRFIFQTDVCRFSTILVLGVEIRFIFSELVGLK